MATPTYATYPILSVESPLQNATNSSWNQCAKIYIHAINTRSVSEARCPTDNSPGACRQLILDAARCNFSDYETYECPRLGFDKGPTFSFKNSSLYRFLRDYPRRNQTETDTSSSEKDSLNIGAIIGALCALLLAITVVTVTVFLYSADTAEENPPSTCHQLQYKRKSHRRTISRIYPLPPAKHPIQRVEPTKNQSFLRSNLMTK